MGAQAGRRCTGRAPGLARAMQAAGGALLESARSAQTYWAFPTVTGMAEAGSPNTLSKHHENTKV